MGDLLELGPGGAEAVFSPCRTMRYRLKRVLLPETEVWSRVVFVMLNPSTADAFKLDRTVERCMEFARRWAFDVIEVVNLYAYRTPKPRVLAAHVRECLIRFANASDALESMGAGATNDAHILERCTRAGRVIAAWGNDGHNGGVTVGERTRGTVVREMLERHGVELHILGTTESGAPLHPLARGKSWIPYDREPQRWT